MSLIYCPAHGLWDFDDERRCPTCDDTPVKAEVPHTVYLPIHVAGVCVGEHEIDVTLIVDSDGDLEEIEVKGDDGSGQRFGKWGRPDAHCDAIWHIANTELRRFGSTLHATADEAVSVAIAENNF
jgi:hypothetical protein